MVNIIPLFFNSLMVDFAAVYWGLRTSFFYRSQQPGQVIWSRDGSILAVAHGCFVTLWSVETNALYRLFTSAEIHNFTRLTFVGRSGRYLCGAGNRGIALFDLIRGQRASLPPFTSPASPISSSCLRREDFLLYSWAFVLAREGRICGDIRAHGFGVTTHFFNLVFPLHPFLK